MTDGTFLHGTTYYHFAHPATEWAEDFRKIRNMGLNTVRVAEIWPGWEVLEPRPGAFEFQALDDYVDAACQAGLNVVMGIGVNNPPPWVFQDIPDLRCVDAGGQVAGRRIQSANHDDPRYRQWMERFIDTHARHYADKPLLAWQFGNEIRYGVDIPDNPLTRERFRLWLSDQWDGDLDALNRAWGTFFGDWQEIYPYRSAAGAPTGGLTPLALATRKYKAWSLAELVEWGVAILRRHSALPVFHNNHDISGSTYSHWEVAALGDVVCQDIYPTASNNPQRTNTLHLDLGAGIARTLGKDLWIGETGIGQYGTYHRNRPDRRQVEALVVEMLAAGAKALLYFRHKPPRYEQPHKFTGSQSALRRDGTETIYAQTPRNVAAILDALADRLTEASPLEPDLAIYWPEESLLLSRDAEYATLQRDALYGAANLFNRLGHPVQWLDSEWLCAEDLSGYAAVYLPTSFLVPAHLGQALGEYVRDGGTLICEGRCGYVDELGWLYPHQPGAGLHEICGVSEDLFWEPSSLGVTIAVGNRTHRCCFSRLAQTLRTEGAEVVAATDQGETIATTHTRGAGRAIYFGFAPSLLFAGEDAPEAIEVTQQQEAMEMLDDLLWQVGLSRPVEIDFDSRRLSFRYLRSEREVLVFVANHGPATDVDFGPGRVLARGKEDEVDFECDASALTLETYDWCIAACPPAAGFGQSS